jgi:hypothetical protein
MEQPPLPIQFQMGGSPQSFIYASQQNMQKNDEMVKFSYANKFKTAVYGFFLFLILSHKVSYKILNMVINLFTNRADIINDDEEPLPLGLFINASILAIILFIF